MAQRDLVEALQLAIPRANTSWISQPSHLRRQLEAELGPDARSNRAQVHQLVVAVEERIPVRLRRHGWTPEEHAESVQLLIDTRGWTAEAAEWTVLTWAAALGLSDERPSAPAIKAHPATSAPTTMRNEADRSSSPTSTGAPPPTALPTDLPSERPSESGAATPTVLPDSPQPTVLPDAPDVGAPVEPEPQPSEQPPPSSRADVAAPVPSEELPRAGMKRATRSAAAFLEHDLDVAYEVKVGTTPAFLLCLVPIALAGLFYPMLSGALVLLFLLTFLLGRAVWPGRILAVSGDRVWLLAASRPAGKPTSVIAEGSRSEIEFSGGRPYPSVRFAGERLWFQLPVTGAARALPTQPGGAAR